MWQSYKEPIRYDDARSETLDDAIRLKLPTELNQALARLATPNASGSNYIHFPF